MTIVTELKQKFSSFIDIFDDQKPKRIGIYGPPNTGKSTLANRISKDWTDEPLGTECEVPHETRRAKKKSNVEIEHNGKKVNIDIVDTPGVATEVDADEFQEYGLDSESSERRAKEATDGIADAMKWLKRDIDGVIYMMDSTEDPFTQVNMMVIGIIENKDIPVLVLANKIDKVESKPETIADAYPQHKTIPVSAKEGDNMDEVYKNIAETFG